MEQRISLITLGVADLRRAMDFYGRLGWEGSSPDGEVAFYQAGGMILGLWDRALLAADSGIVDAGGHGGMTLAHMNSLGYAWNPRNWGPGSGMPIVE